MRLANANALYEQAVFGGDTEALDVADRELDGVEADLALARGRIVHARFLNDRKEDPAELTLFERAAELYHRLGDIRGEAEAEFWIGIVHQVVHGDSERGLPHFERSYALATQAGDNLTLSYAARHIGFARAEAGDLPAAKEKLEESLHLRRALDFQPGVAAALLALAELAHRDNNPTDARTLLTEADTVALASNAHGIRKWIAATRAELDRPG